MQELQDLEARFGKAFGTLSKQVSCVCRWAKQQVSWESLMSHG